VKLRARVPVASRVRPYFGRVLLGTILRHQSATASSDHTAELLTLDSAQIVGLLADQGVPKIFSTLLCDEGGLLWMGGYDPSATTSTPLYTPLDTQARNSTKDAICIIMMRMLCLHAQSGCAGRRLALLAVRSGKATCSQVWENLGVNFWSRRHANSQEDGCFQGYYLFEIEAIDLGGKSLGLDANSVTW